MSEPVGSRIPGSAYFRDYCVNCHEPIRVSRDAVGDDNACEGCMGPGLARHKHQWDRHDRKLTYLPDHGRKSRRPNT